MSFKTKIKLIVILCCAFAAALIAGCSVGMTSVEDFLKGKNAREQCVYYYANGGYFSSNSGIVVKSVYYAEGSPIIDGVTVTADTTALTVVRLDYIFVEWQYGVTDENGDPVLDDDGNLQLTGESFTSYNITEGETLYLGAVWETDVAVKIVLAAGDLTVKDASDNEYSTGDVIDTRTFGTAGSVTLDNSKTPLASKNATFLQFFYDEECTSAYTSVSTTISKPTDGEDITVYAKYIEGVYTVVATASDVQAMFNKRSSSTSFYLYSYSGESEIDCSSASFTPTGGSTAFSIYGNDFTLRNLAFSTTSASNDSELAIFGNLASSAVIEDLTLKDVTVSVTGRGTLTVYALFLSVAEGATLDGVAIENISCTINYPTSGSYLLNGNKDVTNSWLCGGYESDELFFAQYTGVTLTGGSITVNGEIKAQDVSYNND